MANILQEECNFVAKTTAVSARFTLPQVSVEGFVSVHHRHDSCSRTVQHAGVRRRSYCRKQTVKEA